MPRKKPTHQWTRDDPDAFEPAERLDRNEERIQEQALRALATRLAGLPPGHLQRLPLDEQLVAEITHLADLGRTSAHRRQLLRVQGLLRQVELAPLEAALAGFTPDQARLRSLERWRTALIEGGDTELDAFILAHPLVDRQRMRTLIRQARKEGPAAAGAARALFRLMKGTAPDEGEAAGEREEEGGGGPRSDR